MKMLDDMGIAVYEHFLDAAALLVSPGRAATEEEAEEAAEAALATVESEFGRTTDPVRMYMREMGAADLLTREGEIEIAKRMEAGQQAMMSAISASPAVVAELLAHEERIRSGEVQVVDVVDGFVVADEADDDVAEEEVDLFDEDGRRLDAPPRRDEGGGAGAARRRAREVRPPRFGYAQHGRQSAA